MSPVSARRSITVSAAAVALAALLLSPLPATAAAPASAGTAAPAASASAGVERIEFGDDTAGPAGVPRDEFGPFRAAANTAHSVDIAIVVPSDASGSPSTLLSDGKIATLVAGLQDYWVRESNGAISSIKRITPIKRFASSYNCFQLLQLWDQAASKFGRSGGFGPSSYYGDGNNTHLIVLVPQGCGNFGYGSLGGYNGPVGPANGGTIWAQVNTGAEPATIAHEFGHNLGLEHSNSHSCDRLTPDEGPLGSNGFPTGTVCGDEEYGDGYDVMGASLIYNDEGEPHPNALNITHQRRLRFISTGELETITLPSTVLSTTVSKTIASTSATSGLRALRVVDPYTGRYYYIDYRGGDGYEANAIYKLYPLAFDAAPGVRVLNERPGGGSVLIENTFSSGGGVSSKQMFVPGESFQNSNGNVRFTVTAMGGGFATVSITLSVQGFTAPTPTISGTVAKGKTVTAVRGAWTPNDGTFSYAWRRNGAIISGATGSTYVPTSTDVGTQLSVSVTAKKAGYRTLSVSSAKQTVLNVFSTAPTPTISGSPVVGATLTAARGSWSPSASYAFQWLRNGSPIGGATTATYVTTPSDSGQGLSVRVTGSRSGYLSLVKTSAAVTILQALTPATPTITGTKTIGSTLTAIAGSWSPSPVTLTYQWRRDGAKIAGATNATYRITSADYLHKLSVSVTGKKTGYLTVSRGSATLTAYKALTATPTPVISGTPVVGSTLTATRGSWAPSPVTLTFQWLRNGVAISGATTQSYRLVTADQATTITFAVRGSKTGYLPVTTTSTGVAIG